MDSHAAAPENCDYGGLMLHNKICGEKAANAYSQICPCRLACTNLSTLNVKLAPVFLPRVNEPAMIIQCCNDAILIKSYLELRAVTVWFYALKPNFSCASFFSKYCCYYSPNRLDKAFRQR